MILSSGSRIRSTSALEPLRHAWKSASVLSVRQNLPLYLTFASAASILVSIAVSQILLGLSLLAVCLRGKKTEWPPIRLPLALFFLWTVGAVLLSSDPVGGLPQIRKFFVFAVLVAVYSTFRSESQIRSLYLGWSAIATFSAFRGFAQFLHRQKEAYEQNAHDYGFYLDARITGLASHWMTFGGEQMIVLLILAALVLFAATSWKWKLLGTLIVCILWASLVLGLTRSIFLLGVPSGFCYLLWRRQPWTLAVVPVIAAAAVMAAPGHVQERIISAVRPHEGWDSNSHRVITRKVGWEMIKAHPWFGVGPEQIEPQFQTHLPPDIPQPLPKGWYGHLHNVYLQYAAERGIPALCLMIWFIGRVLYDFLCALRDRRLSKERQAILHGAIAVTVALLAEGLFEHNLGDTEILTMFLIVVACGYVVLREENRELSRAV